MFLLLVLLLLLLLWFSLCSCHSWRGCAAASAGYALPAREVAAGVPVVAAREQGGHQLQAGTRLGLGRALGHTPLLLAILFAVEHGQLDLSVLAVHVTHPLRGCFKGAIKEEGKRLASTINSRNAILTYVEQRSQSSVT